MPPLSFDLPFFISVAAIAVMLYCLVLVLRLSARMPGGIVGRTWRTVVLLVTLFTVGYLVTPFFSLIPAQMVNLIVALIFLFGAIYVVVTVKLIYRIIEELA
ncbi:MAG: hypothetical protein IPG93_22800 [Burkholderiales bacterium]|nr:hypothetical protein [Burkholderiales bacterium]